MTSTPARRTFPPRLVLAVLCLGSLSGALMQSLVIPIQSELPRLLGTDAGSASWAVTATLLAAAVSAGADALRPGGGVSGWAGPVVAAGLFAAAFSPQPALSSNASERPDSRATDGWLRRMD